MNKILSLVLFVGGITLIIAGVAAADSFGSDLSRFFTGAPTDKSIWMFVSGIVATAVGASLLTRGSKSS